MSFSKALGEYLKSLYGRHAHYQSCEYSASLDSAEMTLLLISLYTSCRDVQGSSCTGGLVQTLHLWVGPCLTLEGCGR